MQAPVNWAENTHTSNPAEGHKGRQNSGQRRPAARPDRPLPPLHYPEDLPVSSRRADIAKAIPDHQVVIVCGETGSGKTTQLPKICLELGRGRQKMIGHAQPRRDRKTVVSGMCVSVLVDLGWRRILQTKINEISI